ncbi:uncharacterized protein LOC100377618 [Saccoglossus kowalevskii]|uniref:Uncharacterized protein LOC100377618 n=1 Tax=Saccoglossus kowalevskii TaxID=10224 RepID=A0ABM0GNK7_SACKO|nr:PREDICTED: uncharacterized protein LOC100377618 [Saccoglossus kowalevskii]
MATRDLKDSDALVRGMGKLTISDEDMVQDDSVNCLTKSVLAYVLGKSIEHAVVDILKDRCDGCHQEWCCPEYHECCYFGKGYTGEADAVDKYYYEAVDHVDEHFVMECFKAACKVYPLLRNMDSSTAKEYLILLEMQWSQRPRCCLETLYTLNSEPHDMLDEIMLAVNEERYYAE